MKPRVAPSLEPLLVRIDSLSEDPDNLRSHSERNVQAILRSLRAYGQQKPIVVRGNVVIAGNGTLRAARELGWDSIAVVRTDLDAKDARAFAVADNRTAELAAWEYEQLTKGLDELRAAGVDLEDVGFNAAELSSLASAGWESPRAPKDPGAVGEYDAAKDTYVVKIEGVQQDDRENVLLLVNEALKGTGYRAAAY